MVRISDLLQRLLKHQLLILSGFEDWRSRSSGRWWLRLRPAGFPKEMEAPAPGKFLFWTYSSRCSTRSSGLLEGWNLVPEISHFFELIRMKKGIMIIFCRESFQKRRSCWYLNDGSLFMNLKVGVLRCWTIENFIWYLKCQMVYQSHVSLTYAFS